MDTIRYCTSCGHPTAPTDRACVSCGQWLTPAGAVPVPPPALPPPSRVPLALIAGAIAVAVLLIAALLTGLLLARRTEKVPVASPASTAPPPRPAAVTPAPSPRPTDVTALPAGMFCRDLKARQYSYVAAVTYWRAHGQPNQMDADRNGIPCETVYSRNDVASYWSGRDPAVLPAMSGGLLCQDLRRMGYDYAQAVSYWYWQNRPNRMDVDLNGIPCETVYPISVVRSFWGAD